MDQQKVPSESPGPNEQGSVLSIRIPVEMWELLDPARRQFSLPGSETLSISDVARLLLESGAQHPRLEHLAEIALLREQPTKALLRMRSKWEDDQEFSRSEWELLARYAEKGCNQHGFSSDSELPSRESFAQVLEAFLAVWSLRSGADPQLERFYRCHLTFSGSDRRTLAEVVQSIIVDLRELSGATRPLDAARILTVALDQEHLERGANVHLALRPFLPCLYRLAASGHWLAEQRPIRRKRQLGAAPDWLPTFVPDVTVDDFVLSTVVIPDEGELYMDLKLPRASFWLGPYPHIREFTKMIAHLAPGCYWRGRYFKAGEEPGNARKSGESVFQFNGVWVWFTSKERDAVESLLKRAMLLRELQTTLAQLELEYGEL